jgi:hypothetical protein
MDARTQVILAGKLWTALDAAGLEIVVHRQRNGQAYYPPAELVDVVGWMASRGFFLREVEAGSTVLPPRPRLLAIGGDE